MVVVDIDIIHGDHLVQPTAEMSTESLQSFSTIATQLAETQREAQAMALVSSGGRAVIKVEFPNNTLLFDSLTAEPLATINAGTIDQLAMTYYAGSGVIENITFINSDPPREIGARPLPLWRVDFDDAWGTTFYISPVTGALVTRRHTLWRVFDFLWMLHIMDYDEREDVNNTLLQVVTLFAFLLVLSGAWYLYFRLNVKSWFTRVPS